MRETLRVYETLGLGAETLDPPERFLQRLPSTFSTDEAKEAADAEDVARRALFTWLKDLQLDGLLEAESGRVWRPGGDHVVVFGSGSTSTRPLVSNSTWREKPQRRAVPTRGSVCAFAMSTSYAWSSRSM